MSLKINIIANYIGTCWTALMSVIFLPLYLHYIGIEGYGLVGFFSMLSVSLAVLDIGFGAVAGREVASYDSADTIRKLEIVRLLRTIEITIYFISIVIGLIIILIAPLIVKHWLNVPLEMTPKASKAVCWMGIAIAIQFPSSFYSNCLMGFQKQLGLNMINMLGATLKGGGAVLALAIISPTVQTYFAWQAIGSMTIMIFLRILFAKCIKDCPLGLVYSIDSIKRVRHFLSGMASINILSIILSQVDKLILSKVLSLTDFGYYSLAWMIGTLAYRLTSPVFNAFYPKLTELYEKKSIDLMLYTYLKATKFMAVIVVPFSLWLSFYSYDVLLYWTHNEKLANEASGALSVIAIGTLLNAFMHIPYALQLAHSYTRLSLLQNIVSVLIIAPFTWYFATQSNLTAAALPWLIVNAGYVLIGAPLMHKFLSIPNLGQWYLNSIIKPVLSSILIILILKSFWIYLFNNMFILIQLLSSLFIVQAVIILTSDFFSLEKLRAWKNTQ